MRCPGGGGGGGEGWDPLWLGPMAMALRGAAGLQEPLPNPGCNFSQQEIHCPALEGREAVRARAGGQAALRGRGRRASPLPAPSAPGAGMKANIWRMAEPDLRGVLVGVSSLLEAGINLKEFTGGVCGR